MCFNTQQFDCSCISFHLYCAHTYNMHFATHMDRHGPNVSGVPGDFNICILRYSGSRSINEAMLSTRSSLSSLSMVCQNEHPKKKHSETSHIGVWQCRRTEPHPYLHPVCVTTLVSQGHYWLGGQTFLLFNPSLPFYIQGLCKGEL